jgi:hypothetical protein
MASLSQAMDLSSSRVNGLKADNLAERQRDSLSAGIPESPAARYNVIIINKQVSCRFPEGFNRLFTTTETSAEY